MKTQQKVSLVLTVRNEAQSIQSLFESIAQLTSLPNEVVVVDGGSSDETVSLLYTFAKKWSELHIRVIEKPSSIPEGRNVGIRAAKFDWLAITDAGCVLNHNWLEELLKKQAETNAQIVAGFAIGDPQSAFEAAVVPYALVMPDKVDPKNYLPATRSMLLHRAVWDQLGGFPETLQVSEDYVFARAACSVGVQMAFAQEAVVRWRPRSTPAAFFRMVYLQARDDVRAGVVRPKVVLVWGRYVIGAMGVVFIGIWQGATVSLIAIFSAVLLYGIWAILKNIRYATASWYWLPIVQIAADMAVMTGSAMGFVRQSKTHLRK